MKLEILSKFGYWVGAFVALGAISAVCATASSEPALRVTSKYGSPSSVCVYQLHTVGALVIVEEYKRPLLSKLAWIAALDEAALRTELKKPQTAIETEFLPTDADEIFIEGRDDGAGKFIKRTAYDIEGCGNVVRKLFRAVKITYSYVPPA